MKEAYAAYDLASLVYNPSNIGALNNYAYYQSERRDLDKAEEMSYKTVKAELQQCHLSGYIRFGFF